MIASEEGLQDNRPGSKKTCAEEKGKRKNRKYKKIKNESLDNDFQVMN